MARRRSPHQRWCRPFASASCSFPWSSFRAPPGTRIEETTRLFADIEGHVRRAVPPAELDTVIQDIGVPLSGINLVLGDPSMISPADGEMMVALKPKHGPTAGYVRGLRKDLAAS